MTILLFITRCCLLLCIISVVEVQGVSPEDDSPGVNNTKITLPPKHDQLMVFISITSSPFHAELRDSSRKTWLLPCLSNPACDYKFFVDKSESDISTSVLEESKLHSDMVFRDACPLMARHPSYINYGNSPPRKENFQLTINNTVIDSPDYYWRRMYKIDWKVCFMRYARDNNKMAEFHVFVEDDSFICTDNLLHQASLLHNKSAQSGIRHSFRTGTGMFDGFDDSSTFMTRDVALAFANHYDTELRCAQVMDHENSTIWFDAVWQSWGNSWMKKRCDWMHQLRSRLHMSVLKPTIDCMQATSYNVSKLHTKLAFPCTDHTIIMHHGSAGSVILSGKAAHVPHTCEYMLLIDKVKDPSVMHTLWDSASVGKSFHDFSEVFLHDNDGGWLNTLQTLAGEETQCRLDHPDRATALKDCIFETRRRLQNTALVDTHTQHHPKILLFDVFFQRLIQRFI